MNILYVHNNIFYICILKVLHLFNIILKASFFLMVSFENHGNTVKKRSNLAPHRKTPISLEESMHYVVVLFIGTVSFLKYLLNLW